MKETKINIEQIPEIVSRFGLDNFAKIKIGQTRDQGLPKLIIEGASKTIHLDDSSGLPRILSGQTEPLIKAIAKASEIAGDFTSLDLLKLPKFRQACLSEIDLTNQIPNRFLKQFMTGVGIPVFYGSTAGINIAEVLETGLGTQTILDRGIPSEVVFDFDGLVSRESRRIFDESMNALPSLMREKAVNFSNSFEGVLINARLNATRGLINRLESFPIVNFVDGRDTFEKLDTQFNLAQLLTLGRIAGQNPKVFDGSREIRVGDILDRFSKISELFSGLDRSIGNVLKGMRPAGFVYYARDAVIGSLEGIVAVPLKLTDKANIYKILVSSNALFRSDIGSGSILLPITRSRIMVKNGRGRFESETNIDPIALKFLADSQPEKFESLIRDFRNSFKVLSPSEAIEIGLDDRRFFVNDYFELGEKNEV